jgi:hypothetical protein
MMPSSELGRIIARDPEGYFHIVSKDTDFDSIIRHLKKETPLIARHSTLAEIPTLRTPEERIARLKNELEDDTHPRPLTRKTLENKIQSIFENKAAPEFVEKTIQTFIQLGILGFTQNDKVLYHAA